MFDLVGFYTFEPGNGFFRVGAALVFDLTRPETFKSIKKVIYDEFCDLKWNNLVSNQWLIDLRRKVSLPGGQAIPTILLANKGDITTETIPADINDFCLENNIMAWFITSAKNNIQIGSHLKTLVNVGQCQVLLQMKPC